MPKRPTNRQRSIDMKRKTLLLQELAKDMDWQSAAKRAKIGRDLLTKFKKDPVFMEKAEETMNEAMASFGSPKAAISKFMKTQELLTSELEMGNLRAAGPLVKTHEMEYRMHGLFEKDNAQKTEPVSVSITLSALNQPKPIEGEIIDG